MKEYSLYGKDVMLSLSSNYYYVNEGGSFTITLTASGADAVEGLVIPYRIMGNVKSIDYSHGKEFGTFILNSTLNDSKEFTTIVDRFSEDAEYFTLIPVFSPTTTCTVQINNVGGGVLPHLPDPPILEPTFTLTSPTGFITEGDPVSFTLSYTNVLPDKRLNIIILDSSIRYTRKERIITQESGQSIITVLTKELGYPRFIKIWLEDYPYVEAIKRVGTDTSPSTLQTYYPGTYLTFLSAGQYYLRLLGGGAGGANAITKVKGNAGIPTFAILNGNIYVAGGGKPGKGKSEENLIDDISSYISITIPTIYNSTLQRDVIDPIDAIVVSGHTSFSSGTSLTLRLTDGIIEYTASTTTDSNGDYTYPARDLTPYKNVLEVKVEEPSSGQSSIRYFKLPNYVSTPFSPGFVSHLGGEGGEITINNPNYQYVELKRLINGESCSIVPEAVIQNGGDTRFTSAPILNYSGRGGTGLSTYTSPGWSRQKWGITDWGSGPKLWTYAGGGGSGAYLDLIINCPRPKAILLTLIVGSSGTGGITNNANANGEHGLAILEKI